MLSGLGSLPGIGPGVQAAAEQANRTPTLSPEQFADAATYNLKSAIEHRWWPDRNGAFKSPEDPEGVDWFASMQLFMGVPVTGKADTATLRLLKAHRDGETILGQEVARSLYWALNKNWRQNLQAVRDFPSPVLGRDNRGNPITAADRALYGYRVDTDIAPSDAERRAVTQQAATFARRARNLNFTNIRGGRQRSGISFGGLAKAAAWNLRNNSRKGQDVGWVPVRGEAGSGAIAQAIADVQKSVGLPVTGKGDRNTMQVLRAHVEGGTDAGRAIQQVVRFEPDRGSWMRPTRAQRSAAAAWQVQEVQKRQDRARRDQQARQQMTERIARERAAKAAAAAAAQATARAAAQAAAQVRQAQEQADRQAAAAAQLADLAARTRAAMLANPPRGGVPASVVKAEQDAVAAGQSSALAQNKLSAAQGVLGRLSSVAQRANAASNAANAAGSPEAAQAAAADAVAAASEALPPGEVQQAAMDAAASAVQDLADPNALAAAQAATADVVQQAASRVGGKGGLVVGGLVVAWFLFRRK